ncbi:TetR/AcrR family transcriptional regulator [Aldersonia sp. NBC_00410]|uniref:TetR/AcrR family transcriptional regulator n=1 Tax=Aldersonia sp. NBC_00410 TaxID=2975954 RepID=UPI002254ABA2|nr:TetR/AcrR family transcriptional regulator [Aldersonia sp. NBC_00410]MCX5042716.1 TetR/AcrR family transcriptional regulator [Aldersonia sp. NBC_00410]
MVAPANTARAAVEDDGTDGAAKFRRRLLDALSASIADKGYANTTVADIVRGARTSRRTFYEYFPDRQSCLIALLADANATTIEQIGDAVDPDAPWRTQVRQAVQAWIDHTAATPTLTLSWIRDVPALGASARDLHWAAMESFVVMVQALSDSDIFRAAGIGPLSRQRAIMLLGGLRELTAYTLEKGESVGGITDEAVRSAIALLDPDR